MQSQCPTWFNLTATTYHYATQPLPGPLAWMMHHLPLWIHKLEVGVELCSEVIDNNLQINSVSLLSGSRCFNC